MARIAVVGGGQVIRTGLQEILDGYLSILRADVRPRKRARQIFILGAWSFLLMGLGHALTTFSELFIPCFFAPVNARLLELMAETPIGITGRTSIWLAYLGFNLSHAMGLFLFGFVFLLLARYDFGLILRIKPLLPLAIAVALAYFLTAVFFWFFAPAIGSGLGAAYFTLSFLCARKDR